MVSVISGNCVAGMEARELLLPGLPDELAQLCLGRVPLQNLIGVCKSWRKLLHHSKHFQSLRLSLGLTNYKWLYALLRKKSGEFCWFAFDPLLIHWHPLPAMPEGVHFQLSSPGMIGIRHSVQCVSTSTKLILVAGSRIKNTGSCGERMQLEPALDSPLVFDTTKCRWMRGRPFTVPRRWCACGMVEQKLYVASGCGAEWNLCLSTAAEMYDLEKEIWKPIKRLSSSKFSGEAIHAVNLGGKLHMVSGMGVFARVGVIFCPQLEEWAEMPAGMRDGWSMQCVSSNGSLYVVDNRYCGRLKVYDPQVDGWKVIAEDERLLHFEAMAGAGGKLCGHVVKAETGAEAVNLLRIVDVSSQTFEITDVEKPEGEVVAMQILGKLRSQCQLE